MEFRGQIDLSGYIFLGFHLVRIRLIFCLASAAFLVLSGCSVESGEFGEQGEMHVVHGEFPPLKTPEDFSEVTWDWRYPQDIEVHGVHPISIGVAVQLDDGVVALSGKTGEEAWSYRDVGSSLKVFFSTSGEQVVLQKYAEEGGEVTVIDSTTGQITPDVTEASEGGDSPAPRDFAHTPFELDLRVDTHREGSQKFLTGFSLSSGERLWTQEKEIRCEGDPELESWIGRPLVLTDIVLAPLVCAPRADGVHVSGGQGELLMGTIAFSATDGTEAWRLENEFPQDAASATASELELAGEGNYVLLNYLSEGGQVVDPETGELLFSSDEGELVGVTEDGFSVVADPGMDSYQGISQTGQVKAEMSVEEHCWTVARAEAMVLGEGIAVVCAGEAVTEGTPHHAYHFDLNDDGGTPAVSVELAASEGDFPDRVEEVLSAPGALVITYRDSSTGNQGILGLN